MDQKQLEKLKACELEMLKAFADVCEKLQLKYFVIGGTLLGAVQHEGFIPWDDDIDVGMPRADYERFIAEGQKYLPEWYFVQTMHSDPEWPANFAKIRDCRTTFIEKSVRHLNVNHGAYIDIFPLDFYPENRSKQIRFDFANRLLNLRIRRVFYRKPGMESVLKKTVRCSSSALALMIHPSLKSAVKKQERLYRAVSHSNLLANHCGAWGKKEIVPAHWYGEGVLLQFEGIPVRAPKHYDKWLTQVYGDYMQLPPVEKRVGHHDYEVLDLDKPYTEYIR